MPCYVGIVRRKKYCLSDQILSKGFKQLDFEICDVFRILLACQTALGL